MKRVSSTPQFIQSGSFRSLIFCFLFVSLLSSAEERIPIETSGNIEALAEQISEEAHASGVLEFPLFHLKGRNLSSDFKDLLQRLVKRGLKPQGYIIDEEGYERQVDEILAQMPSEGQTRALLVKGRKAWFTEGGSAGVIDTKAAGALEEQVSREMKPQTLRSKVKRWFRRVFGTPYGITLIPHFVKKVDGQTRWRYGVPDASEFNDPSDPSLYARAKSFVNRKLWDIRAQTVEGVLLACTLLGYKLHARGLDPTDFNMDFWGPVGFLAAWVGAFTFFQQEWSSFLSQGVGFRQNPQAFPGKQINVSKNLCLFLSVAFVQSFILNQVLVGLIYGWGKSVWSIEGLNALLNTILSVYAKYPMEALRANLQLKAQQALEERTDEGVRRSARYTWIASGLSRLWGYFYSVTKNLHLFAAETLVAMVGQGGTPETMKSQIDTAVWWTFTVIGTLGATFEIYRSRESIKNGFSALARKWFGRPKKECGELLVWQRPAVPVAVDP